MHQAILKCLLSIIFLSFSYVPLAQPISIIPQPENLIREDGHFLLNGKTAILYNQPELKATALHSLSIIKLFTGTTLSTHLSAGKNPKTNAINLLLDPKLPLGNEAYTLSVDPTVISIRASSSAGILYGMQTLLQLLSADGQKTIPCVSIQDKPRFAWRGLLLDVSRHFFQIADIKRLIDEMVQYKFNRLHLHLADDQGWRVEIKSLPQLTAVGAWRVSRTGLWWQREPPQKNEPATYGGFYTREQLKDLIQYARERHIEIMPEIDVPGHSLAAIASYPWLSCTKLPYSVNPGSLFYEKDDNALCPGQEASFDFLDKVFTEIADIFPFEYIHIGGDECTKVFWDKCDSCKKRMTDNHLANTEELQSYFVKRIEKILKSKGKKLLGWDEILEGGIAPDATVMSWRSVEGGVQAAKQKHDVVMTPASRTYLDLYQGDAAIEPPTYSMLRLKDVYAFEPVPDGTDTKYILGTQGNLWTESVPTFRHAEYMYWPRALALSEVAWSPAGKRDWKSFVARTEQQFKRLDKQEINYSRSMYDAIIKPSLSEERNLQIQLDTEIDGLDLFYTFNNTYPDKFTEKYRKGEKLQVPKDADTFRVITYKDGKPIGRMIVVSLDELIKRVPKSK